MVPLIADLLQKVVEAVIYNSVSQVPHSSVQHVIFRKEEKVNVKSELVDQNLAFYVEVEDEVSLGKGKAGTA